MFLFISEKQLSNLKAVVFRIISSLVRLKQGESKLKPSPRVSYTVLMRHCLSEFDKLGMKDVQLRGRSSPQHIQSCGVLLLSVKQTNKTK